MKIFFLNNFYYLRGGSERVLFEEMRIFKEAGHEVAIFSRSHQSNEPSEYERYFPQDIETDKLNVSMKALKTVKELIYSGAAKEGFMKVIDEFKPDIAHAHNIYGRLSLSVLDALKERGIPTVLTLHDYKLLCPSYLMLNHGEICEKCKGKKFINAALTKCHKNSYPASAVYAFESWFNHRFEKYESVKSFISPSRFLRDKAIEFGWSPEKIEFVPNFIVSDKIQTPTKPGQHLLYLGRLSHEKGVITLLKAYSGLRATHPARNADIPLMIVGDGPIRTEVENTFGYDGEHIRFTGYLSGKPLEDAIAAARAIVLPSEWYENAPLSLIEAFAHGKPVIGARIGGIPEMIDDGVNGLLFESGNIDDLKDKLQTFLNLSDDDVMKMGKAAREKAETEYNPKVHYDKLLSVYQNAIKKK